MPIESSVGVAASADDQAAAVADEVRAAGGSATAAPFDVANADTLMDRPTQDLIDEFFPGVPCERRFEGTESPQVIDQARTVLGYEPRHGWRTRR